MNRRQVKKWSPVIGIVLVLAAMNLVFLYYSPREIVNWIGVENSYLVVFLIAAFGGLSSFTSGVLYASLATFASGGASWWLLGIAGGIGIAIGDTILFTLMRTGVQSVPEKWQGRIDRLRDKLTRVPDWLEYLGMYFYLGFTPLPNDIFMFFLATAGYKYRVVVPMVIIGGITIASLTALLGGQLGFLIN